MPHPPHGVDCGMTHKDPDLIDSIGFKPSQTIYTLDEKQLQIVKEIVANNRFKDENIESCNDGLVRAILPHQARCILAMRI